LRNKREVLLAARVATFLITGIASLPSVEWKSIQPAQGNSLIIKTNDLHQQKNRVDLYSLFRPATQNLLNISWADCENPTPAEGVPFPVSNSAGARTN
jgi:hypothetical protein